MSWHSRRRLYPGYNRSGDKSCRWDAVNHYIGISVDDIQRSCIVVVRHQKRRHSLLARTAGVSVPLTASHIVSVITKDDTLLPLSGIEQTVGHPKPAGAWRSYSLVVWTDVCVVPNSLSNPKQIVLESAEFHRMLLSAIFVLYGAFTSCSRCS